MTAIADIPQLDGDGNVSVAGSDESRRFLPRRHPGDHQPSICRQRHRRRPQEHRQRHHLQQRSKSPPSDPASGNNKCCECHVNVLFNYDFKKCVDCLKKLIGAKCFASSQEYHLKCSFKYVLEYCQAECNCWEIFTRCFRVYLRSTENVPPPPPGWQKPARSTEEKVGPPPQWLTVTDKEHQRKKLAPRPHGWQ